ncbi:MAG: hypothetical protein CMJ64_23525 [Planctomycetaceae bacterium]|nr:hypothetical protein [Planctomycetaceae bacterium]
MTQRTDTDCLAALIDQKSDVLSRLRQLATRQAEIVSGGDMTKLFTLLASKQALLQNLQRIETQLDPFRAQDPDARQWRSSEHRQRARAVAERCESLLAELMAIEKQCEGELSVRCDNIAERLQGMHHVTHATDAYTQQISTHSQLDLSSET